VYTATYEDLVRFLYRKVWDAERARDLAQEAFVRALRREPARELDQPRSWLFTVANNLARDEARAAGRRVRHLRLLKAEAEVTAALAPEGEGRSGEQESPEIREMREQVRAALETLGEREREILLLWDAGLSYEEIAAESGLALTSIGTTLARARRRLVEAHEELEGQNAARG